MSTIYSNHHCPNFLYFNHKVRHISRSATVTDFGGTKKSDRQNRLGLCFRHTDTPAKMLLINTTSVKIYVMWIQCVHEGLWHCSWLVVWNMNFIFPIDWEVHNPNWRTYIFQRGRSTTNQIIINHHELYNNHILTIINSILTLYWPSWEFRRTVFANCYRYINLWNPEIYKTR